MTDTYHIQISVYVNCEGMPGAKAGAGIAKGAIEGALGVTKNLDEVIIHSVVREDPSKNHVWGESTENSA